MGEYFMYVNATKAEFLHPHRIGVGLKFWESCPGSDEIRREFPLQVLLGALDAWQRWHVTDSGYDKHGMIGRWIGDRVTLEGDYGKTTMSCEAVSKLRKLCRNPKEFDRIVGEARIDEKHEFCLYHLAHSCFREVSGEVLATLFEAEQSQRGWLFEAVAGALGAGFADHARFVSPDAEDQEYLAKLPEALVAAAKVRHQQKCEERKKSG